MPGSGDVTVELGKWGPGMSGGPKLIGGSLNPGVHNHLLRDDSNNDRSFVWRMLPFLITYLLAVASSRA
jgi:hypothetical protein